MTFPLPGGAGPGGPPPSISLPGSGGGAPGSDAGPSDPDSGSVTAKLKQALKLVQDAAALEGDDTDAASLSAIAASIHKAIANEQGLVDKAMGSGPGVKLVRKAAAGAGGPVGGY